MATVPPGHRPPHPTEDPKENMSDDPGPVNDHQEDIAGQDHGPIPRETERDDRDNYSGGRTGNW